MKRIVVACDGTWDRRDRAGAGGLTNVARMHEAVLPQAPDGTDQLRVYDDGIGSRSRGLRQVFEGATGLGIGRNVREAYRAVCRAYEHGDGDGADEVWLFGFSRGAYTVRSVAGMLRSCGVVEDDSPGGVRRAYRQYRNRHHPDCPRSREWREEHARVRDPRVHFLGVWDTVGALGIPFGRLRVLTRRYNDFHDVQLSGIVRNAHHAVAIDERRTSFQPTLWATKQRGPGQVVEQRWFPGVHRDVGGGHVDRDGRRYTGLSDAAFAWMADRARAAGLALDEAYVAANVRPEHLDSLASDTLRGFWRLRPHVRYIGDPRVLPQEPAVEALERHRHPPARYRPENLLRFLEEPDAEQPGVVAPPRGRPDCRTTRCRGLAG